MAIALVALAKTVGVLLTKADQSEEKALQFRASAGQHAIDLKARFGTEYKGQLSFPAFCDRHVGYSASSVNRLIREHGKPLLTDQRIQEQRDYRTQNRPTLDGNNSQPAKTVATYGNARIEQHQTKFEAEESETDNEAMFLLRASQAFALAAYTGPVDKRIVRAARQAADAWSKLANTLERKLK